MMSRPLVDQLTLMQPFVPLKNLFGRMRNINQLKPVDYCDSRCTHESVINRPGAFTLNGRILRFKHIYHDRY